MSGNELRVTVTARDTYTNTACAHTRSYTQAPTLTEENREHSSFELDTKHRADGAQEERERRGRSRKSEKKTDRDVKIKKKFCIICSVSV